MSPVAASCPGCGGQVEFRIDSSIVTVCDYCSSVVARSDRSFESVGKASDLVDSKSPLDLWLEGKYDGYSFVITGRAQLRHGMGGMWDEWYCAFSSGHWGWLAEAQGKFYMTFAVEAEQLPPYQTLVPGQVAPGVGGGAGSFVVAEKGEAEMMGAKGEIPYVPQAGRRYWFADLSGPGGEFATIDYSESPPKVFMGREVTLAELGIAVTAPAREDEARQVDAARLGCPNCSGSVDLVAPDRAERVGCPYCGALLDVNQGNLVFLKLLDKGRGVQPAIALGTKGEIEGHEMTIVGFVRKSGGDDYERWWWDEYLLYNPRVGFRWLVCSDGHWSFVEPLAIGDVNDSGTSATYDGKRYRHHHSSHAVVEHVIGEFYWKVEADERVAATDFIRPPLMLSCERSATEINWSLGTYRERADIQEIFDVELPKPTPGTVAPNQLYPHKAIYRYWALLTAAAIGLVFLFGATSPNKVVFEETLQFPASRETTPQVQFSDEFVLGGRDNIEIRGFSPVDNSWVYLQGDLYNVTSGEVQPFDMAIEYYRGAGWTEGSTKAEKFLAAVPVGTYVLRLGLERKDRLKDTSVRITIRQGVTRYFHFGILFLVLALIPGLVIWHHVVFEKRRSGESSDWSDGEDW